MNKEQFEHYIKGGMFKGIYNPKITFDLSQRNLILMREEIQLSQNLQICPIQDGEYRSSSSGKSRYVGQFRFNSDQIDGMFPEEDIENLEIINEFVDNVEPLPVHMFKLVFDSREVIMEVFGNAGKKLPCPMTSFRNFTPEGNPTEHIKRISSGASEIFRYLWKGDYEEKIKWKLI